MASLIPPSEFCDFVKDCGWPANEEVDDNDETETTVNGDNIIDFEEVVGEQIFGIGRSHRNVGRDAFRCVQQCALIEKGICNWIDFMGHDTASKGHVLMTIQGESQGPIPQYQWFAAILSGTIYSPKVFDVLRNEFPSEPMFSDDLDLPVDLKIMTRQNMVARAFRSLHSQTSDEFIFDITSACGRMWLYEAVYTIPLDVDQSIMWSRVTALKQVGAGPLCEPGMDSPLLSEDLQRKRKPRLPGAHLGASMRLHDPFVDRVKRSRKSSRRGVGGGRGGRRGGRGRGRGRAIMAPGDGGPDDSGGGRSGATRLGGDGAPSTPIDVDALGRIVLEDEVNCAPDEEDSSVERMFGPSDDDDTGSEGGVLRTVFGDIIDIPKPDPIYTDLVHDLMTTESWIDLDKTADDGPDGGDADGDGTVRGSADPPPPPAAPATPPIFCATRRGWIYKS